MEPPNLYVVARQPSAEIMANFSACHAELREALEAKLTGATTAPPKSVEGGRSMRTELILRELGQQRTAHLGLVEEERLT